jgi:hypothetical protein
MKTTICIGLAICSLAGINTFAQETDVTDKSAAASATAETETDTTVEENGARPKRNVRIERRLPGGGVELEEFRDDGAASGQPKIRRRIHVIDDDEESEDIFEDRRIDIRPQIRVFPKEKEMIVRRPGQGEIRLELGGDQRPMLRKEMRVAARGFGGADESADAPIEHLEQAIRHLKRAKMPEMAARLEAELSELRARRSEKGSDRLNEQIRSLREERDALREELRKLKRAMDTQRDSAKANPPGEDE